MLTVVRAEDIKAEDLGDMGFKAKIQWLISKETGAPNFSMRRFIVEKGGEIKEHSHNWEHEIYILQGEATVKVGDKSFTVTKDTAIYIPPNVPHSYKNTGNEALIFLCIIPNK